MNTKKYMQTDSPWSELGYPSYPCYVGREGCGMVSIANILIEMKQYENYTPATIQPYCRQYAAPNCDGTYHSGIPAMMKHYGLTEVQEHANMDSLWKELAKGGRVAIYLMGSRPGGSRQVHWTSGGHFVASVGYRYQNNDHQVYIKDSYSNSELRNGWLGYKTHLKGDVSRVWSGKLVGTPTPTPTPPAPGKLVVDGIGGYETVKRLQQFLKLSDPDGLIARQRVAYKNYFPALTAVSFASSGSSNTIRALQQWLGLSGPDGILGKNTTSALQRRLRDYGYLASNETIDGIIGVKTMKALQTALNNDFKKITPTPPTPTPTPTKSTKVIDVSYVQRSIDWAKVKAAGIDGAMIRCGYRGYETGKLNEDDMFMSHIKGASKAGLKVGVYFFTEALNYKEGEEEAEFTLKLIEKAGVNLYYPIAVDTEAQSASTERAKNLSKAQRTDAIKGFCDTIKSRGGVPMIYASLNWFDTKLDMSKLPFDIWCAQYYTKCEYKGKYVMWQYTSKGNVNGVSGVVDMNECYITSASPMPKPVPQPTPDPKSYSGSYPTTDEIKAASNKGIINNTIAWAKDIAKQGFAYLWPQASGCYFCGTLKKKAYTCMPYVTAMFAHGGGDPDVLNMCKNKHSFSLIDTDSDWQLLIKKGKFKYLGRMKDIKWTDIKPGDVLVQYASDDNHGHMMLYCGGNRLAEAIPEGCKITNGAKSRYERYAKGESQTGEGSKNFVMRYIGSRSYLTKGDEGTAVTKIQEYLNWYTDGKFFKECGNADGIYGNNTLKYVVKLQTDLFGAKEADGTIGNKTIQAMKTVKK